MITNKGTQTIQTERLKLRRFTVDDAQARLIIGQTIRELHVI